MTCCNVVAAPDLVIAASDSEQAFPTGDGGAVKIGCTKIFALHHQPGIVAGRGWHPMIATAAAAAALGDPLAADSLEARFAGLRAAIPAKNRTPDMENTTIVRAGWSPGDGRMILQRWDKKPGEPFAAVDAGAYFIAPWDQSLAAIDSPTDAAGMKALIVAQVKLLRRKVGPTCAAGGKIVYAEVTPTGITISHLGDLE